MREFPPFVMPAQVGIQDNNSLFWWGRLSSLKAELVVSWILACARMTAGGVAGGWFFHGGGGTPLLCHARSCDNILSFFLKKRD